MRHIKLVLVGASMAMLLVAFAAPAIAQANNPNWWNWNNRFDDDDISQSSDQDVESGASSQGIIITGGGDNSNQCIGLQPISNTGNTANQTGVLQYGSDGDVGTSGGDFQISPSQTTTCDQKVDQAASASGQPSGQ